MEITINGFHYVLDITPLDELVHVRKVIII